MGAKGKSEIRHLTCFGNTFVKLGRLVLPGKLGTLLAGLTKSCCSHGGE
jgi:hypothetical protein